LLPGFRRDFDRDRHDNGNRPIRNLRHQPRILDEPAGHARSDKNSKSKTEKQSREMFDRGLPESGSFVSQQRWRERPIEAADR
jgi:hypothetical protein